MCVLFTRHPLVCLGGFPRNQPGACLRCGMCACALAGPRSAGPPAADCAWPRGASVCQELCVPVVCLELSVMLG